MKYSYRKNMMLAVIKRDIPLYFVLGIVLLLGLVIGSIAVKILDYDQKKSLVVYMNKFFQLASSEKTNNGDVFLQSLKSNFQTVFFLWIFSLTVIGIPFALFVTGFKGFITGFTIAFLVEGFGYKGLLFSIAAILPQSLLMIICTVVLAVECLKYSLGLLKRNITTKGMKMKGTSLFELTAVAGGVMAVMTVLSAMEALLLSPVVRLASGFVVDAIK